MLTDSDCHSVNTLSNVNSSPNCTDPGLWTMCAISCVPMHCIRTPYLSLLESERTKVSQGIGVEEGELKALILIRSKDRVIILLSSGRWLSIVPENLETIS